MMRRPETVEEAIQQSFNYINNFKRNRALADIHRANGDSSQAHYNELFSYKEIDKLELLLRTIQKVGRTHGDFKNITIQDSFEDDKD